MRRLAFLLLALALALIAGGADANEMQIHVVGKGQTIGRIAKRYQVTIDALLHANGLKRRDRLHPGQKLVIPDTDDTDGTKAARYREENDDADDTKEPPASGNGLLTLQVPNAPPAYYYEPVGRGRLGMRPVIMYLHGRGGRPSDDCRRWAPVARRLGWLVCPSGQEDRGGGARGWDNNWPVAEHVVTAALEALHKKYPRRVQRRGNTLVGFSEGAYVAMNVGVREPQTFNRWMILAADSDYWGAAGLEALQKARASVHRVYLITGAEDGVIEGTGQVRKWLEGAGVAVHASTPNDMGHEVALDRKPEMYRAALVWLDRGSAKSKKRKKKSAEHTPTQKGRER